jgi:anti-sigma-K factor RskA
MIDDHKEELASLHAFGLLEGAERDAFVAEIENNPELRKRVDELRFAATALAHSAPEATPPEALRARILSSVARLEGSRSSAKASNEVAPFPVWFPWLAAACLTAATVLAGRKYAIERQEYSLLAEKEHATAQALDQTDIELAHARKLLTDSTLKIAELSSKLKDEGDLAHFKISTLASMLGNSPQALAVAVWDPSRERGVLSVSKLPALATEKDYQLWVIDKNYPAPVSAGTFVVDPVTGKAHIVFKADKPVESIAKFAVSLERKGGSPSPQGPIVLISQ